MRYADLCDAIRKSEYKTLSFRQYLIEKPRGRFIVLRHDVDKKPLSALRIAEIEKQHGIISTYFFRIRKRVFNPSVISKLEHMGFEIGYHYEELADTRGNLEKAILLFEENLGKIRKVADVKTICMHGSTLSRWDNRKLWENYDFKEFGLIGEGYLSVDFSEIAYVSDSGGHWYGGDHIKRDFPLCGKAAKLDITCTDDLIHLIVNGGCANLYILSHPDRWNNGLAWYVEYLSKYIRNTLKIIINKII